MNRFEIEVLSKQYPFLITGSVGKESIALPGRTYNPNWANIGELVVGEITDKLLNKKLIDNEEAWLFNVDRRMSLKVGETVSKEESTGSSKISETIGEALLRISDPKIIQYVLVVPEIDTQKMAQLESMFVDSVWLYVCGDDLDLEKWVSQKLEEAESSLRVPSEEK